MTRVEVVEPDPARTVDVLGAADAAPVLEQPGLGQADGLTATGEAATNIKWTARAVEVREIPAP